MRRRAQCCRQLPHGTLVILWPGVFVAVASNRVLPGGDGIRPLALLPVLILVLFVHACSIAHCLQVHVILFILALPVFEQNRTQRFQHPFAVAVLIILARQPWQALAMERFSSARVDHGLLRAERHRPREAEHTAMVCIRPEDQGQPAMLQMRLVLGKLEQPVREPELEALRPARCLGPSDGHEATIEEEINRDAAGLHARASNLDAPHGLLATLLAGNEEGKASVRVLLQFPRDVGHLVQLIHKLLIEALQHLALLLQLVAQPEAEGHGPNDRDAHDELSKS
mmetsp:Transcript_22132/g.61240  ORF Transcript_22132/g.61240 Transcript_22132/m.61240 type:complete len:283 (+) Transcript_22132:277-1125(+)